MKRQRWALARILALLAAGVSLTGKAIPPWASPGTTRLPEASDVLAPAQWQAVNQSIERALTWLAAQQMSDGSFASADSGQPAITSLCVMAFLAGGHLASEKPYGPQLNRAVDYVL